MLFIYTTVGFWLGIYAFRGYVPAAVWNLSDALPLYLKGAIALGVHLAGVVGMITPLTRRPRAAMVLAVALALTGALRQVFIADDNIGSVLSLAAWILWLWWLAAFARTLEKHEHAVLAPAFAAAFAFQAGMQAAWHGLDLPMAAGPLAIACAVVLNAGFALGAVKRRARVAPAGEGSLAFVAVGIAFFLELTLLANVGRISVMTNLSLAGAALLIQAASLAGILSITLPIRRTAYLTGLAVYIPLAMISHAAVAAIMVFVAQASLVGVLAAIAGKGARWSAGGLAAGMTVAFILVFAFYTAYELPALWVLSALMLAALALSSPAVQLGSRRYVPIAGASALLSLASLIPMGSRALPGNSTRILTYNIHQGYDTYGTPAMQRIADEIGNLNADVIALQEVGRGWDFVGGADLVSYLRYRFPNYTIHFVPTNGELWGVALMSRVPLSRVTGGAFDAPQGAFGYGYVKAYRNDIAIVAVHLTAGLEGNGEGGRADQAEQLLRLVEHDQRAVVAGDFNAHPQDAPIRRMLARGYTDAGAVVGLGRVQTWPAGAPNERIDYVFLKGDLEAGSGEIRRTRASDHLPVLIALR